LGDNETFCSAECGFVEDRDHLFFKFVSYGRLWLLIVDWLGISTAFHENVLNHSIQFRGLGGFSNNSRLAFNII
jgi:hypothetical protein